MLLMPSSSAAVVVVVAAAAVLVFFNNDDISWSIDAAPIIPLAVGKLISGASVAAGGPLLISPMYFRRTSPFFNNAAARRQRELQRYRQQQQQRQQQSSSTAMYQSNNISEHYLDNPNWMTDPNIRTWNGTGRSSSSSKRSAVNQGQSWTSKLVVMNVVSFIAQQVYPKYTSWGVKLSHKILNGKELYRLISPVFLHGDLIHIAMNMYSLQNVGPIAERYFGNGRFIMSYLVAGAAGNLLSSFMSINPALGASGAIFGVSGMLLVFLQRNEWLFGRQGEAMQTSVIQTLGMNLLYGFMNPRVDNYGHLGGAIGGAMMAYYFGPRLFLAPIPGTESVVVVDKPILRLPRWLESFPEKSSSSVTRLVRRMQVWKFTDNLPSRPWRKTGSGDRLKRSDYKRRQFDAPNQSIKPNIDDM
mmetsp:Transcript_14956/g.36723  ORF Transcript_14956/g.36723 Transcript_14956/m.36723 type:complete len:415 (-) Transcript_14956:859-2103(-)